MKKGDKVNLIPLLDSDITKVMREFVDEVYPKGNEDRGFALVCLSMFLMSLKRPKSLYKIVKNG